MGASKFQSTPPRGGATRSCRSWLGRGCYFNPRPREGGRPQIFSLVIHLLLFQSTPPRGGATMWNRWRSTRHRYFNPRPREGGRRPLVLREISIDEFQSTPPRGGATAMEDNKPADTWISIHAPARGGDAAYQLKIDALEISIHAPARGGDHHGVHLVHRGRIISIHAPARGATSINLLVMYGSGFQSTPPRGGRRAFPDVPDRY